MNIKITKAQLEEVRNHLNESPDKVLNSYDDLIAHWSNDDAIAFGFLNGRAFVGYNNTLFFESNKISQDKKYEIDHTAWKSVEKMQMHRGISDFYGVLYGDNGIGSDRSSFEHPGRLWTNSKVISFWQYPDKNKMPSLLKELSTEIEHIYGLKVDFSNYRIEIKTNEYQADLDADDEDYEPDYEWETNSKIGNLIPVKNFMGSNDSSASEMQNIHTLSSAEKMKTPQMKASLDAKYKNIGDKLGNVTQAEYNHYKRYGMGEGKTILITKEQLNEINKHLEEEIKLPVKVGDTIMMGKFKNKKVVIKTIGEDDFGMPTINGKKAATFRIPKKIEEVELRIGNNPENIDCEYLVGKTIGLYGSYGGRRDGKRIYNFKDRGVINSLIKNGDRFFLRVVNSRGGLLDLTKNITTTNNMIWTNSNHNKSEIIISPSVWDYCKQINNNKLTEATIEDVNLSSFKPKKELNTKFWDESGKLKPIVRKRLLKIADDFIEYLTIDIKKVNDIVFLGSMANFNWSSYSDVDLHLIVDFSKINKNIELVTEYFDSKRRLWNEDHENLKIFGFPIELYVQDIKQENASVGQFSLEKNKWLSKPEIINDADFDKKKIKEKASTIMTNIENLLKDYKSKPNFTELTVISNKTKKLYDKIKKLRKQGLESEDGELSIGNIVFKVLRRNGYFEKLIDLKLVTYDKINSIK